MSQHTQKPRSPRVQQLKRSEDRKYTSFKELGVLSPRQEEFEDDGNSEETGSNEERADQDGKAEGSGRRENETMKGEGTRQRSSSMRVMEWLMRPKISSSPP